MPFIIRRARTDDAEQMAKIRFDAFETAIYTLMTFPNGVTPGAKQDTIESTINDIEKPFRDDGGEVQHTVAEDTETGQLIAASRWIIYRQERPQSEWDQPYQQRPAPPGGSQAVNDAIYGGMHEQKRQYVKGDAHFHFTRLTVAPEHQGKGAGTALLKVGLEIADKERLYIWIESTPIAQGLYHKYGFQDVDALVIDYSQFGHEGQVSSFPCMKRPVGGVAASGQ